MVLTDTFQLGEDRSGLLPEFLRSNSERARLQSDLPITVILGNPPYSVGQGSENDNNANLVYPRLDGRIRATYAKGSTASSIRSLYDSYIRAIRWATDRIGPRGIVCFVTNGAFIDSASADGLRKSLDSEFSAIRCLNLRGNMRSRSWRQEGGQIFGSGSQAPIAITVLVKDPGHAGAAELHYHDIGDYLSREDKLACLTGYRDVSRVPWRRITPNAAGDWINQRSEAFAAFAPLGDKRTKDPDAVFSIYSNGVKTNRDAWAYNFSHHGLATNMAASIAAYNDQREQFAHLVATGAERPTEAAVDAFADPDPNRISWTRALKADLRQDRPSAFDPARAVRSLYRPFCKAWLYFDRQWNEMVYRMPSCFPTPKHPNRVIAVSGVGAGTGYSVLMTNLVVNRHAIP